MKNFISSAIALCFTMGAAQAEEERQSFKYAAKVVCVKDIEPDLNHAVIGSERYKTVINLMNPNETAANLSLRFVDAGDGVDGGKSPIANTVIAAGFAQAYDCARLGAMGFLPTAAVVDGFLAIESNASLEAVAVYSAGFDGHVRSIDIEPIRERMVAASTGSRCQPTTITQAELSQAGVWKNRADGFDAVIVPFNGQGAWTWGTNAEPWTWVSESIEAATSANHILNESRGYSMEFCSCGGDVTVDLPELKIDNCGSAILIEPDGALQSLATTGGGSQCNDSTFQANQPALSGVATGIQSGTHQLVFGVAQKGGFTGFGIRGASITLSNGYLGACDLADIAQ